MRLNQRYGRHATQIILPEALPSTHPPLVRTSHIQDLPASRMPHIQGKEQHAPPDHPDPARRNPGKQLLTHVPDHVWESMEHPAPQGYSEERIWNMFHLSSQADSPCRFVGSTPSCEASQGQKDDADRTHVPRGHA